MRAFKSAYCPGAPYQADDSDLRPHQARELRPDWAGAPARALFHEPRTGKTRIIVRWLRMMARAGFSPRVLIVGPQKPLSMTWVPELQLAGAQGWTYDQQAQEPMVYHDLSTGALKERKAALREIRRRTFAPMQIVLLNYEALTYNRKPSGATPPTYKPLIEDVLACEFAVVIVDEGHLIKGAGSARARALRRLGDRAKYRRLLTGTPDPQGLLDLYGQYRFLEPELFGTNKQKVVDEYFYQDPVWRSRVEILDNKADEFKAKAFSIASRVKRNDVLDVPTEDVIVRRVELPSRARTLYDKIAKDHILEGEHEVDATHKLSRIQHLHKLAAGYLKDTATGELKWIHDEKTEAAMAELSEIVAAGEYVVLSYVYKLQGDKLEAAARREFGENLVARLHGRMGPGAGEAAAGPFDPSRPRGSARVLIVQEQVGSLGISLARAPYLILASWWTDYATHRQLLDRIYSPGEHLKYIYLQASNTVDGWARSIVQGKDRRTLMNLPLAEILHYQEA